MSEKAQRYPALMDGHDGAYGIAFPDLPGCTAMGFTVEEAIVNAEDAMQDWVEEMENEGLHISPPSPPHSVDVPDDCWLTSVQRP